MWTKVKQFFTRTPKPLPRDLSAVVMLQQIVRMHKQGKIVFPRCDLQRQQEKIFRRADNLGLNRNNLNILDTHIKQVLSDQARGRTVYFNEQYLK